MTANVRIDVRPDGDTAEMRWRWVAQSTKPVRDRFVSADTFATRAEAVADFEDAGKIFGWTTKEPT